MEHFREHNTYLQGLYHNRTYYDLLMMVKNQAYQLYQAYGYKFETVS